MLYVYVACGMCRRRGPMWQQPTSLPGLAQHGFYSKHRLHNKWSMMLVKMTQSTHWSLSICASPSLVSSQTLLSVNAVAKQITSLSLEFMFGSGS